MRSNIKEFFDGAGAYKYPTAISPAHIRWLTTGQVIMLPASDGSGEAISLPTGTTYKYIRYTAAASVVWQVDCTDIKDVASLYLAHRAVYYDSVENALYVIMTSASYQPNHTFLGKIDELTGAVTLIGELAEAPMTGSSMYFMEREAPGIGDFNVLGKLGTNRMGIFKISATDASLVDAAVDWTIGGLGVAELNWVLQYVSADKTMAAAPHLFTGQTTPNIRIYRGGACLDIMVNHDIALGATWQLWGDKVYGEQGVSWDRVEFDAFLNDLADQNNMPV